MTLHPNAQTVADTLAGLDVRGQVHMFVERVDTAVQAAERLGVDVGAIADSLVFNGDEKPFLIMASGAHRVDTDWCAALLGVSSLRRATPEFVKAATGQPMGGVAPVGHPRRLRTLVDVALRDYETIWATAGHPNASFPTTFDELVRITNGTPVEMAK